MITSQLRGHLPKLGNKNPDVNIGGKGVFDNFDHIFKAFSIPKSECKTVGPRRLLSDSTKKVHRGNSGCVCDTFYSLSHEFSFEPPPH